MASSPPASNQSLVGAVLSRRWRLARKLGEGGMGEVYAADPVEGGPRVALKLLRREFLSDGEVRSRFLDEGRTCMRLVHPNIVRVVDCAQAEDGTPYIAMELLDGVPLAAYMQDGARIPPMQAVPILQSILAGLSMAHAQGVVHRDLKPDNVFLNRDSGGAFVVKLLDFGIAKVMEAAGGMGNRTRTGVLLGTPAYMSPEQARSARDVDQRADLWSAGVLLYEMVTGRPAFPAPTDYARLTAVLSVDPEPVDRIDPSPAPLAPVLEKALKKSRDDRYVSAIEMAQALGAAIPGAGRRSAPPLSLAEPLAGTMPDGNKEAVHPATGGTLASPRLHNDAAPGQPAGAGQRVEPAVVTVPPEKIRRNRRYLPVRIVGLLVAAALVIGFLCGWWLGRLR